MAQFVHMEHLRIHPPPKIHLALFHDLDTKDMLCDYRLTRGIQVVEDMIR
jgi:hypothetical protein